MLYKEDDNDRRIRLKRKLESGNGRWRVAECEYKQNSKLKVGVAFITVTRFFSVSFCTFVATRHPPYAQNFNSQTTQISPTLLNLEKSITNSINIPKFLFYGNSNILLFFINIFITILSLKIISLNLYITIELLQNDILKYECFS